MRMIKYVALLLLSALLFQSFFASSSGAWGIFHYYLGAKYIKEVGYFDLYTCSLQAYPKAWESTSHVRDLHTYSIVSREDLPACPKENFTPARWNSFKKDLSIITAQEPATYWEQAVTDKGFNPPPSWVAIAGVVANLFSLNPTTMIILFNLDLLFICLGIAFIWYTAGRFLALFTFILTFTYFGTSGMLGNNFIQYAWYPCLIVAIIAWHRKKMKLGGSALACAAGLQAFPGVFVIPVLLYTGIAYIQGRTNQFKLACSFLLSFSLVLGLLLIVGILSTGKATIWQQWSEKISIHRQYLSGEIFDIGFPNLLATTFSTGHSAAGTYADDYAHTQERNIVLKNNMTWVYVVFGLTLLWVSWLLWISPKIEPLGLGIFLIYFLLSLSPYYYLSLALIPLFFWDHGKKTKRFIIGSLSILFGIHYVFFPYGYISFEYFPHLLSELLLCLFLVILASVVALQKKSVKKDY